MRILKQEIDSCGRIYTVGQLFGRKYLSSISLRNRTKNMIHRISYIPLVLLFTVFVSACGNEVENNQSNAKISEEIPIEIEPEYLNDWEFWDLSDSVKILREKEYVASGMGDDFKKENLKSSVEFLFDESGKLLEIQRYNDENEVISRTRYKYTSSGLKKEETITYAEDAEGPRFIYGYDNYGRLIEQREYQPKGGLKSVDKRHTYEYDGDGHLVEENDYYAYHDSDEVSNFKTIYDFNEEKKLIGKGFYTDDELIRKFLLKTDQQGNVIEEMEFYADGKPAGLVTFAFDESKNPITENVYTAEGNLKQTTHIKYNADGEKIEESLTDAEGNVVRKTTYQRDSENHVTEQEIKMGEELSFFYEYLYEYDEKGNWLKRIDKTDGNVEMIIERSYEYYP